MGALAARADDGMCTHRVDCARLDAQRDREPLLLSVCLPVGTSLVGGVARALDAVTGDLPAAPRIVWQPGGGGGASLRRVEMQPTPRPC